MIISRMRVAIVLLPLLLVHNPAQAAPRKIQVAAGNLRETITGYSPRIHATEITLKDGSLVKGKQVVIAPGSMSIVSMDKTKRSISYDDIGSIRMDLGPRRGWQVADAFIFGVVIGQSIGIVAAGGPDYGTEAGQRTGGLIGLGAGAVLGVKIGSRHRKITILEVK